MQLQVTHTAHLYLQVDMRQCDIGNSCESSQGLKEARRTVEALLNFKLKAN